MVMEQFDLEERWPELFDVLTDEQRRSVVNTLVDGWHEGWEPTREDVENLSDYERGAITFEEYGRRNDAAAEREYPKAKQAG